MKWNVVCSRLKRCFVGQCLLKCLAQLVDSCFLTQACVVAHPSQGTGESTVWQQQLYAWFAHTAETYKWSAPVIDLTAHVVNINVSKHGRKKRKTNASDPDWLWFLWLLVFKDYLPSSVVPVIVSSAPYNKKDYFRRAPCKPAFFFFSSTVSIP